MYAAVKELVPDAAFAIFTGDIVDHAVWNTTQAQNTLDINDAYSRMSASGAFPYVFGTAGNHEASPANAFPPVAVGDESQWVLDTLASDWSAWIGSASTSEVKNIGAYSATYSNGTSGNLRVISLNTNLYYVQNYYLYEPTSISYPSRCLLLSPLLQVKIRTLA
jgi:sphingomyelin phosphodiesterase